MNDKKIKIDFFIDDSGSLHKNSEDNYFFYAGVFFINNLKLNRIRKKYLQLEKDVIKDKLHKECNEIKASSCPLEAKLKFLEFSKSFQKIYIIVEFRKLEKCDISENLEIIKHKQFLLLKLIWSTLDKRFSNEIKDNYNFDININIDKENKKLDEFNDFKEWFSTRIKGLTENKNWFKPIPNSNIEICYKDSKNDPLIRVADFIANDIYKFNEIHNGQNEEMLKYSKDKFCNFISHP